MRYLLFFCCLLPFLAPTSAFASCADLSRAFFGIDMAGERPAALPQNAFIGSYPNPMGGGWSTFRGESYEIDHRARIDWNRDGRVTQIEDSALTSAARTFEHYRDIISEIAGTPFALDPVTNNYALACEPGIAVHACEERFPAAPQPRMKLFIRHELNEIRYSGPSCRPLPPDALPERGPVLETQLTPAEIEEELAQLRTHLTITTLSENLIDSQVARARAYYAATPRDFRTADRLALFPEITAADELAFYCSARFVIPPVHYGYASPRSSDPNAVDLKTMGCRTSQGEMYCTLRVERALRLEDPAHFFLADESVDDAEALTVASLYLAQTGSWQELNRISREGDRYLLHFGRRGCACFETRTARLVPGANGETGLELEGVTNAGCS